MRIKNILAKIYIIPILLIFSYIHVNCQNRELNKSAADILAKRVVDKADNAVKTVGDEKIAFYAYHMEEIFDHNSDEDIIFDSYSVMEDAFGRYLTYYIYKFQEDPQISSKKMLEALKTIQNIEAIKIVKPSNQGGIKIFKEKDGKLVEVDEQDKVVRIIE